MLDDDDVDFAILMWPSGGWVVGILGFILIVVMLLIVQNNKNECSEMRCARGGSPILMHHECLCVERPVSP